MSISPITWVSPKSDPALYRRSSPFISRTLALSDPKILFAKKNRPIPLAQVALPESFWLEWLQDELPLATEPAEVEALDDLHRRACAMCPTGPVPWRAAMELGDGRVKVDWRSLSLSLSLSQPVYGCPLKLCHCPNSSKFQDGSAKVWVLVR